MGVFAWKTLHSQVDGTLRCGHMVRFGRDEGNSGHGCCTTVRPGTITQDEASRPGFTAQARDDGWHGDRTQ